MPTLYVLNAAAVTKLHAIEHLTADFDGYSVDIAVVTETHLKAKHADHSFSIDGYNLFRRDRIGRRGGGVAVYVHNRFIVDIWKCPGDTQLLEILWLRVQDERFSYFVGAVYHPPKPIYPPSVLLDCIEASVDELTAKFPSAVIVLAGDFNTLNDAEISSRSALHSIVNRPTRGVNFLDRIYVSSPCYATVKVVTSTLRSDHKAIIAYTGTPLQPLNKTNERKVIRRRSPTQHAQFLHHISQLQINVPSNCSVQHNFDTLYAIMHDLLDSFYPEEYITVTSSDPPFVTPVIKALLRRKNRLMHKGRVEEASALSERVRTLITRRSSKWLRNVDIRKNPKEVWNKVSEVLHGTRRKNSVQVDGITAQVLNEHYASISTDAGYQAPCSKQTVSNNQHQLTEWHMFRMLDKLKPTATGLDGIPAWFLRLGAPIFAAPLAELINLSLASGIVPVQWKTAIITPIAKVANPTQPSDFRPISVTSILSRLTEQHVVRNYLYPTIQTPPVDKLSFDDQYAFRPYGSTTAAVIALLHTVRSMLQSNEYVRLFSFDLTKAFDTVRHSTLMAKMASLDIPDNIYNWICDFFCDRHHCTKYAGRSSTLAPIQASVVQGSGLGPASYIITAADLHPIVTGNRIFKFADDTYLVIPASNAYSCSDEIQHIQSWAADNNLKLNQSKSKELIFTAGTRCGQSQIPTSCLNIERVSSLRILGVIVNDRLTADDHVNSLVTSCSSLLYAFRVLRSHGIPDQSLHDIFHAVVIAKLTYCAPAWSGGCSAADRTKLDSFLNKCRRVSYCSIDQPPITKLFDDLDNEFFSRILLNSEHLLQQFLPDRSEVSYNLRTRPHKKLLLTKSTYLNSQDFLVRMLYKHSY